MTLVYLQNNSKRYGQTLLYLSMLTMVQETDDAYFGEDLDCRLDQGFF